MKTILYLSILLVTLCVNAVQGQKFKTFENFNDLEKALVKENDTLYVINFWATWCAPCVKELPHFESYNNENSNKKIKVILVMKLRLKLKMFQTKKFTGFYLPIKSS